MLIEQKKFFPDNYLPFNYLIKNGKFNKDNAPINFNFFSLFPCYFSEFAREKRKKNFIASFFCHMELFKELFFWKICELL